MAEKEVERRIAAFAQLGKVFEHWGKADEWPGESIGLTREEYDRMTMLITTVNLTNGWFTIENVRSSFTALSKMLDRTALSEWAAAYDLQHLESKRVGVIMAGNIPMVGFHDLLCVLLSGHKAIIKYSSDDNRLLPGVIQTLFLFHPQYKEMVEEKHERIGEIDAVIATGSNNSARYFEHYFGKLPHIIRKNRSSVAILSGQESDEELKALGKDVFQYFGLGCRNVTKLYLHKDFDLDRFFGGVYDHHPIGKHSKYGNNYEYHKALWLMDGADLLENGFLLLKEDEAISSPVAALYYERFEDAEKLDYQLRARADEIQCIVGHGHTAFGKAQEPELDDYADGLDTMAFLTSL